MHPILPESEGENRYALEDQNGIMIIQEIMKVCQSAEKGGFNQFYFHGTLYLRSDFRLIPLIHGRLIGIV